MNSDRLLLRRLVEQERISRQNTFGSHDIKKWSSIHNPVWRQMVVEWCYHVVDHISADRELVYIAVNILDRFLSVHFRTLACNAKNNTKTDGRRYLTDKRDYETAVMTALLLTLKLQGITSLSVENLVQMSSNSVSSTDILEVGQDIIHSLKWNSQIPTAARFAHVYVQLLSDDLFDEDSKVAIFESTVFQIELSIQDEAFSYTPPSLVAWMAFENALSEFTSPLVDLSSVRHIIAKETGHDQSMQLREKLQHFQARSFVRENVNIIPLEEEEQKKPTNLCTSNDDVLILKNRPLSKSHVISIETFDENTEHKRKSERCEPSNTTNQTLPRVKRTKFH
ncbi:hypothetical protein CTEN210_12171 [Chaetoceros tenuissimus]|uniref:Cyclin N-terminal domain-containing protein n=1 Tax=Chaetoceros tenuissimus TaxID=426638 RepID=A0AAD3D2U2_9STRA|nr:hypothetical protein CTEN210_12171 [Chaetoceros tenuissimus]